MLVQSAVMAGGGDTGSDATARSDEPVRKRYVIRTDSEKRYLASLDAPNIAVRLERGLAVSGGAARKAPEGTIYLDGAAAGEPFMDTQRQVYNLDHHEGCVRSFTLSTCEQAMVLSIKGLDLRSGEWTLWANEPDLDTVLAIWVLLNHHHLSAEGSEVRRTIMPVLRLEGAIDAGGLRFAELCGFPEDLTQRTMQTIDELRREELFQKSTGNWSSLDFLEHTRRVLHGIDALVYAPGELAEIPDIEEIARVPITGDRIAVICRAGSGIYEVERGLAQLHGNRVGLIALQTSPGTYTLRQSDSFLPISLDQIYERLNTLDPAVRGDANRWGGSAEIGGSPRRTGTALSPGEIGGAVQWVYRQPSTLRRALAVAAAVLGAVAATALGLTVSALGEPGGSGLGDWPSVLASGRQPLFAVVVLAVSACAVLAGWSHRHLLGLGPPRGWRWIPLALVGAAAGVLGGAWSAGTGGGDLDALGVLLLAPLACELMFRGAVHGLLAGSWRIQHTGGRWFVSVPTLITAVLSAAFVLFLTDGATGAWGLGVWSLPLRVVAALVFSVACGVVRERSASVLPPVLIHLAASLLAAHFPF
jgi:hypothetical protein